MKHIQELDFMKLARLYALHDFWANNDPMRKQYYVVHSQKEAESIKPNNPQQEVISLSQASDLPMMGSNIEIYLSRLAIASLLYQGKSAIEYLQNHLDEQIKSMGRFQQEMKEKLRKEQDAHINTAQNLRDQINLYRNKLEHMEKTAEMLSKEVKKYELVISSEKSKKKKELIDKLCQENELLKQQNEALDAQLQAYQKLDEDHI